MSFIQDINAPTLPEALLVSIINMAIVFLVLLIISFVIDITAAIVRKSAAKKAAPAPAAAAPAPVVEAEAAPQDDSELVIVAAAAIAAALGKNLGDIQVRRITRVDNNETLWTRSSRLDSVR